MEPLSAEKIATGFDEIQEEGLVPFDGNPNQRLPHDQQRVYRIKDLFIAKYRTKICRYTVDREMDCKVEFHMIFADNRFHALQLYDEITKLKIMADADHYEKYIRSSRESEADTSTADTASSTGTSEGRSSGKTGELSGTLDAIQLGSVISPDKRVIETSKLPDYFDENIRGYSQGVNVNAVLDTSTTTGSSNATSTIKTKNKSEGTMSSGSDAINHLRAHTIQLRRIREEFIQCFNVLFY